LALPITQSVFGAYAITGPAATARRAVDQRFDNVILFMGHLVRDCDGFQPIAASAFGELQTPIDPVDAFLNAVHDRLLSRQIARDMGCQRVDSRLTDFKRSEPGLDIVLPVGEARDTRLDRFQYFNDQTGVKVHD
jgi:hypothetical protein